jgi:hypothetical protein
MENLSGRTGTSLNLDARYNQERLPREANAVDVHGSGEPADQKLSIAAEFPHCSGHDASILGGPGMATTLVTPLA